MAAAVADFFPSPVLTMRDLWCVRILPHPTKIGELCFAVTCPWCTVWLTCDNDLIYAEEIRDTLNRIYAEREFA